ncbi:L-arabinokinase [Raphanus sativus]|nr:L-arabinokinase [Raphanus sativus]
MNPKTLIISGLFVYVKPTLSVWQIKGLKGTVSSTVPEGKGVSSSAAVEVASMSAVAAGCCARWRITLLELHVVLLDQMTSSCGEANKLLAMICQLVTEASVDYLCNLWPHRYEARYADKLPDFMLGCHYSYSACGLGSDGTNRLVVAPVEQSASLAVTHCAAANKFSRFIRDTKQPLGYLPLIFKSSSPGAGRFGYLARIRIPTSYLSL